MSPAPAVRATAAIRHLAIPVLAFAMRILLFPFAALLFALPAKADKFWFSDPAARQAAEGSLPDMIAGVLLSADADTYRIRTVGGELVLAKKSVVRVEKDGLTVEAIERAEKDAADALAAANRERELRRQIGAKEREIRAAEAAVKKGAKKPVDASAPTTDPAPTFDPVLDVAKPRDGRGDELRRLFEETGDRDLLRALRLHRRMR